MKLLGMHLYLVILVLCAKYSYQDDSKHKPAQGRFLFALDDKKAKHVSKTVYNQTRIFVEAKPTSEKCNYNGNISLRMLIVGVHCKGLYSSSKTLLDNLQECLNSPTACAFGNRGAYWEKVEMISCVKPNNVIPFFGDWTIIKEALELSSSDANTETKDSASTKQDSDKPDEGQPKAQSKRSTEDSDAEKKEPSKDSDAEKKEPSKDSDTEKKEPSKDSNAEKKEPSKDSDAEKKEPSKEQPSSPSNSNTAAESESVEKAKEKATTAGTEDSKPRKHLVTQVPFMGDYIIIVDLKNDVGNHLTLKDAETVSFDLDIKMISPVGYLSADEYPLKTFYLIMCIVYVLYAVAWLIMSACNYHDLLRVQFWIGGVILLGLIEKAVHYAEYLNVNETGISEMGTEKFAAFVSCVKRTVARMLVIIVSLGFGIVKPRLGPTLHRVIGVGVVYFIIALLEQMLAIDVYFNESSRQAWMFTYIPLSLIDSIICYWIFMSLLQTMKTLRLRRNTTKLSLYRHFANTIVFCVVISIGMMLWAIHYHEQFCNEDFAYGWFETACWPMLFSLILLVIMILWRPNANNQRYAYSPMIDGNGSDDDDVEEPMLGSGATETMKMRGTKKIVRSDVDRTEEDLKWIEENIPQTVADAAVPVLLDSDEEQMSTKYEMSKME